MSFLCRVPSAHFVTSSPTIWQAVCFMLMVLLCKGSKVLNSSLFQPILDFLINVQPQDNLKVQTLSYFGNRRKGTLYLSPTSTKNSWTDFPNSFPKVSCLGWAQPWKFSLPSGRPEKVIKGKWKPWKWKFTGKMRIQLAFSPGWTHFQQQKIKPKQTVSRIISPKSLKL